MEQTVKVAKVLHRFVLPLHVSITTFLKF